MSPRGVLRIYLGAAAGVGTTYAMLDEGLRRRQRGADVAVGYVDTHGRASTEALLAQLDDDTASSAGALDVDALIARHPDAVLVDDLAARNPTGDRHAYRWQDVDELLEHDIDVVTTLSVQHIQALAAEVEQILGAPPHRSVPDAVLAAADQIELVDISPEAIRRRVAHGNVVDRYSHPETTAVYNSDAFARLRLLLLAWMADRLAGELGSAQPTTMPRNIIGADEHHERGLQYERAGRRSPALTRRRRLTSLMVGALAFVVLTLAMVAIRGDIDVATALGLYLLVVVAVAAIGGSVPGVGAAVLALLLVNFFLVEPYHTLRVDDPENVVELVVFVTVALVVSTFVSIAARRSAEAEQARREATSLARLAGSSGPDAMQLIIDELCASFELEGVAVLEGGADVATIIATAGTNPPSSGDDADFAEPISGDVVVAVRGRALTPDEHRVLRVFLQQLAVAIEHHRLAALAAEADTLARADELRTAILRAVSHDLRSPLAGIKASVSSLRQDDVVWPDELRDEFLASIEDETDRLTAIVSNLLDMSRLQAGALRPALRRVALEEVVPAAVHSLGARASNVDIALAGDLPDVVTDPALLERALANLISNAIEFSPDDDRVRITAHEHRAGAATSVQLCVIDHGPGIRPKDRSTVVQPFHRLSDDRHHSGVGLGLAIADGLSTAMGATLELRDTPRGGLTVVLSLPVEVAVEPQEAAL